MTASPKAAREGGEKRVWPFKFSGRADYFAVNDKTRGYSTSFRVSGRLGEVSSRFALFHDADSHCRALNRAYRLGLKHGVEIATPLSHSVAHSADTAAGEVSPSPPASPAAPEGRG